MTNRDATPNRRWGLRSKVILIVTLMSVLIALYATGSLYSNLRITLLAEYQQKLLDLASVAALVQDGAGHDHVVSHQAYYMGTWNRMNEVNESIAAIDSDILSIYTFIKDDQGNLVYVLDTGRNPAGEGQAYEPTLAGTRVESPSYLLSSSFDTLDEAIVEEDILTTDETRSLGGTLSAYAPFYNPDGERAGVIAIVLSAASLRADYRQALATALGVFAIAIPIAIVIAYVVGNTIVQPMLQVVEGAQVIAGGNLEHKISVESSDETSDLAAHINYMTSQLRGLFSGLEERVADRTRELAEATRMSEKRTGQYQAIASVAREIASLGEFEDLLKKICEQISAAFGYYHIGIFLSDQDKEYVVLRGTNSPGGQKMLARDHRLKIGEVGIVGNVAYSGEARIALDTSKDAVFFNNPDLPETRSEMALPLRVGDRIIGVLDVQSTEQNAFATEEISVLGTLADQVSIAIENSRLFETTQRSLAEAELAYRDYLRKELTRYIKEKSPVGFVHSHRGTRALDKPLPLMVQGGSGNEEAKRGKPGSAEQDQMLVPIRIRNETIGVIGITLGADKVLTPEQLDLVRAVADRLSLSAENARLFEETTRRAERERTVTEISTRIRGSANPQEMLQTAIEELRQILGASDIKVRPYATLRSKTSGLELGTDGSPDDPDK